MRRYIDGSWQGWDGNTVVKLTDGSVWQQVEYLYEYRYSYRPEVVVDNHNRMLVVGMSRPVRMRRLV